MSKLFCIAAACCAAVTAHAFDVKPSKEHIPNSNSGDGGKRFDIFAGDPERIKRANEIKREDFEAVAVIRPADLAVDTSPDALLPTARIGILLTNKAKKPKTLSFPDAQRVDVLVRTADGREVYRWSSNKKFMQVVGTSMVMPGEKLSFDVEVPMEHWSERPRPEIYQVEVALANYPEFVVKKELRLLSAGEVVSKRAEEIIGPTPPSQP